MYVAVDKHVIIRFYYTFYRECRNKNITQPQDINNSTMVIPW